MNLFVRAFLALSLISFADIALGYHVGVGRADITGPAAEVTMMGYAKTAQKTKGIHMRLYARAFIIKDNAGNRVVYVSSDAGQPSQLVKFEVIKKLKSIFNGIYHEQNVLLHAQHTHSGPGGYMQYFIFNLSILGFVKQSLQAMVDGIIKAIQRAHNSMVLGKVYYSSGFVSEVANINRSPTSYNANPASERGRYQYNTDRDMVQLNFVDSGGRGLGVVSWYPVHGTSMTSSNRLISGDNKGAASLMFEKKINPSHLAGRTPFVAAFSNSNLGDTSPNILGASCINSGKPCEASTSTCNGKPSKCVAKGPGKNMFESTKIIASRQFKKSYELFTNTGNWQELTGPVGFKHQWVDMSNYKVRLNGTQVSTCKSALGYSFAAGATDGPGEDNFKQGTLKGSPFINFVTGILGKRSPSIKKCQAPKPILLLTGEYNFPFLWEAKQVETQVLRVDSFLILAVPGEITTMAGRRLRESVAKVATENGLKVKVVIAGPSNTYTHYITTFEEYQKQRYEAASTIFGPHSLSAYIQQFGQLTTALMTGRNLSPGTRAPNLRNKQLSFVTGVVADGTPLYKAGWFLKYKSRKFGECIKQPKDTGRGSTVSAKFQSGHPRNSLMQESTFMAVEKKHGGSWKVVATDTDWETKFEWKRTNVLFGYSEVTVSWDIPRDASVGTYRLMHQGYWKKRFGKTYYYKGHSKSFTVR